MRSTPSRRARLYIGILIAAVVAAAAVTVILRLGSDGDDAGTAASIGVTTVPVPDESPFLDLAVYYPKIEELPEDDPVNIALQSLVLDDLAGYEDFARQEAEALGTTEEVGAYAIDESRAVVESHEGFVSVALLVQQGLYHGMGDSYWLSTTVDINEARPVEIWELLIADRRPMAIFTQLVILELLKDDGICEDMLLENNFLNGIYSNYGGGLPYEEWDEHVNEYTYIDYAVTGEGIFVAFDEYGIGSGACGSMSTLIEWPVVEDYLSDYGRTVFETAAG
ncbi:hypothetical protein O1R50_18475 [Glycomyces luteolus]|uniref:DUF3298 domain-containing protein n=1 Tax=Glycomyces luteolus TaxID=2670330 RepID=A0A9X3PDR7_9ACTN|nr:hypothetical protein [Glycomyces luteolus]MDA1361620.1 hypothetical protein [Glycomyces luteolus]